MKEPFEVASGFRNDIYSVGQIIELGEKGEILQRFCSGFNISNNYFLTAGHCFGGGCYNKEYLNKTYYVNYGYQFDSKKEQTSRVTFVKGDYAPLRRIDNGFCTYADIDYSVCKIGAFYYSTGTPFTVLPITITISPTNTTVVAVHHPEKKPKKLSFGKITDLNTSIRLRDGPQATGLVDHSCSIARGSAGSPLVDQKTGTGFAVNVAVTYDSATGDIINHHALPIQQIVKVAREEKKHPTSASWLKAVGLFKPKKLVRDDSRMPLYHSSATYDTYKNPTYTRPTDTSSTYTSPTYTSPPYTNPTFTYSSTSGPCCS